MKWTEEALDALPIRKGFRMRGENMTRLEVFSDAAFAFALTMLVVSVGSVPSNLEELIEAIKRAPAFALSFTQISVFWIWHRTWSRQFGLEDGKSSVLTLSMIFVVLIYVYPLRLIFSSFLAWVSNGWLPTEFNVEGGEEIATLFVIYGIGYAALSLILTLLNRRALALRDDLRLNPRELIETRRNVEIWTMQTLTGVASTLFCLVMPTWLAVYGGFVYFLQSIGFPIIYRRYGKRLQALESKAP